jgi:hypothetical protein
MTGTKGMKNFVEEVQNSHPGGKTEIFIIILSFLSWTVLTIKLDCLPQANVLGKYCISG